MATFDARPVIAAGGEPSSDIMAAVASLGEDEELIVLAPFEPVPPAPARSRQLFCRVAGVSWSPCTYLRS